MTSMVAVSAAATRPLTELRFGDVVHNCTAAEKEPARRGISRFVGLEHLDPGSSRVERWGYLDDGTTFTRLFKPGNVLFGKRRAYLRKAALVDFSGVCSGDILVFEPNGRRLAPELLPHIVQTEAFVSHALRTSAGSLSPRTKWRDLANFELRLPDLVRQREIADLLAAADHAERALSASWSAAISTRLAYLAEHAAITLNGKTCGDVVKLARSGGTPNRSRRDFYGGSIPWLKSGEVTRDGIAQTEETLTDEGLANSSAWLAPAGAVVVAMYGAGTTRGQVGALGSPMATNQAVLALIADERVADQRFLYHWLASRTEDMRQRAAGAVQPNLSKALVLEEPFPSLSLEEQRRLAVLLDRALATEAAITARVNETAQLRTRLREELLGRYQGAAVVH
jgi:type I restriction enzyme S subunit